MGKKGRKQGGSPQRPRPASEPTKEAAHPSSSSDRDVDLGEPGAVCAPSGAGVSQPSCCHVARTQCRDVWRSQLPSGWHGAPAGAGGAVPPCRRPDPPPPPPARAAETLHRAVGLFYDKARAVRLVLASMHACPCTNMACDAKPPCRRRRRAALTPAAPLPLGQVMADAALAPFFRQLDMARHSQAMVRAHGGRPAVQSNTGKGGPLLCSNLPTATLPPARSLLCPCLLPPRSTLCNTSWAAQRRMQAVTSPPCTTPWWSARAWRSATLTE